MQNISRHLLAWPLKPRLGRTNTWLQREYKYDSSPVFERLTGSGGYTSLPACHTLVSAVADGAVFGPCRECAGPISHFEGLLQTPICILPASVLKNVTRALFIRWRDPECVCRVCRSTVVSEGISAFWLSFHLSCPVQHVRLHRSDIQLWTFKTRRQRMVCQIRTDSRSLSA